jgi:Protein of unknown function (DUF2442)
MPARAIIPTHAEIDAALANPPPKDGPRASSIAYSSTRDEIRLVLEGGVTLVIPRSAVAEFRNVPKAHMRRLDLTPGGAAIALEEHDIHIFVPGLIRDLTRSSTPRRGVQRTRPNTAAFKAAKPRAVKTARR